MVDAGLLHLKTCWTVLSVHMNAEKRGEWGVAENYSIAYGRQSQPLPVRDVVGCSNETGCDLIVSHLGPAMPAVVLKHFLMMLSAHSPSPTMKDRRTGDGHQKISRQETPTGAVLFRMQWWA